MKLSAKITSKLFNKGLFVHPTSYSSHHASHLKRLINLFSGLIQKSAIIAAQDPLQLDDFSEPEPDFMLLRPSKDFYYANHPLASDVFLLIEIAGSSIDYDQTKKLRLYALHNIPEYWLLNINDSSAILNANKTYLIINI